MKKLFNFLAKRKSPEGPPAELDVEKWVKELDEQAKNGQLQVGLGDTKVIGFELIDMNTGDVDLNRRVREAQIKIDQMSNEEQTALIQTIFVREDVKMFGKFYAGKTFNTLSGNNKSMMIRHVAEQLKTWEEHENKEARTKMWLAARR